MNQLYDCIILGAGISGLTLAFRLKEAGKRVLVLEKSDQTGGAIQTIHKDGWTLEGGPNTILVTNTWFSELIEDIGLKDEMITASENAKNRFIVKNGTPRALPLGPAPFLKSSFFSARTKWRIISEPFRTRMKTEDETLADFVIRRLGREFLDYAINPFVAGVYAGKPEDLSVRYGFPKLYQLEKKHGSLIIGAIKGPGKDRDPKDIPRSNAPMVTFKQGNQQLITALIKKIGEDSILCNHQIETVTKEQIGTYLVSKNSGEEYRSRTLVSTIPSHALESITFEGFAKSELFDVIKEIHYPPVSVVHLGFNKKDVTHPLDGFGMLVPEKEPFFILGALFNSTLFEGRTPSKDQVLITVFTGGSRHPNSSNLSDDELMIKVLADLRLILGVQKAPIFSYIKKWNKAIPQYDMKYGNIVDCMKIMEMSNTGFHFCGNIKNGISIGDCIKNASTCAASIRDFLDD